MKINLNIFGGKCGQALSDICLKTGVLQLYFLFLNKSVAEKGMLPSSLDEVNDIS